MEVPDQSFVALIGPTGCGKSTVLNLVAGFIRPTRGNVLVDGAGVEGPSPHRGVVFQDSNLFPWLTVARNVAFGPTVTGILSGKELRARVDEYLDLVGLLPFRDRLPLDLSGGMRQRVALARVLINEPALLLMDEPFGALDAQTRMEMQELLLQLWERDRKTVLFVTHDIEEALLLADTVYVMSTQPGRIRRCLDVPLSRPRRYEVTTTSEFAALKALLLRDLRSHNTDGL